MGATLTTAVAGTAEEVMDYLRTKGDGKRYFLLEQQISPADAILNKEGALTAEEEAIRFEEMGRLGEGRLDKNLTYDRDDIYFDRY